MANQTDQVSEPQALLTLTLAVNVILNGIFCIFGYTGNILAIIVLARDKVRNSNIFLLQVLAAYDIFFLTHTVLYTVLRSVYPSTGYLKEYYNLNPYIIAFVLPFGWIAQTGTIWFTTFLAADRYYGITRPFKALTLCTLQNAKKVTAVVSILAFLFNFPRFFYYFNVAVYSDNNSTFIAHVRINLPGFDADLYRYIYHITLTFIFLYIIPLTALTVLNFKLIKTLRVASKARKRMSMSKKTAMAKSQNIIITTNLVIVISKFILCETPDFISSVIGAVPGAADKIEYKMFNPIKETLLVFNSSVNFYIYCIFNGKFRENLLKLLHLYQEPNVVDTRLGASTHTLTLSLSSLTLAATNFKKGKGRQRPTEDYRKRREHSESSEEVLEEREPPEEGKECHPSDDWGRERLKSTESQLTVTTNADSTISEINTDVYQNFRRLNSSISLFSGTMPVNTTFSNLENISNDMHFCENEDYLVFKPYHSEYFKNIVYLGMLRRYDGSVVEWGESSSSIECDTNVTKRVKAISPIEGCHATMEIGKNPASPGANCIVDAYLKGQDNPSFLSEECDEIEHKHEDAPFSFEKTDISMPGRVVLPREKSVTFYEASSEGEDEVTVVGRETPVSSPRVRFDDTAAGDQKAFFPEVERFNVTMAAGEESLSLPDEKDDTVPNESEAPSNFHKGSDDIQREISSPQVDIGDTSTNESEAPLSCPKGSHDKIIHDSDTFISLQYQKGEIPEMSLSHSKEGGFTGNEDEMYSLSSETCGGTSSKPEKLSFSLEGHDNHSIEDNTSSSKKTCDTDEIEDANSSSPFRERSDDTGLDKQKSSLTLNSNNTITEADQTSSSSKESVRESEHINLNSKGTEKYEDIESQKDIDFLCFSGHLPSCTFHTLPLFEKSNEDGYVVFKYCVCQKFTLPKDTKVENVNPSTKINSESKA